MGKKVTLEILAVLAIVVIFSFSSFTGKIILTEEVPDISILSSSVNATDDFVWVANEGSQTVSRINKSNVTDVSTINIPASSFPRGIGVDQDSVWTANRNTDAVSRINKSNVTDISTITVGDFPVGVALDQDFAWVANRLHNSVSKINKSTNSVVATIGVGTTPEGLAVDQDSVWTANGGSNTVSRINKSTNSVIATINVGSIPQAVAIDQDFVWVSNGLSNTISRINKSNVTDISTITVGSFPLGVAVDQDSVWVGNRNSDTISRINKSNITDVSTMSGGNGPYGTSIDQDSVWVNNFLDNTVSRINKSTNSIIATINVGGTPRSIGDATGFSYDLFFSEAADTDSPEISLISPANKSSSLTGNLTFNYNVSDVSSINNCSLIFLEGVNQTNTTITKDTTQNFSLTDLSVGNYNWNINCTDSAANNGSSETRFFSVSSSSEFSGDSTDLSNVSDLSNIINLTLHNPEYGKITWQESVDLSGGADLDANVNISFNRIEVNSSALSALNVSAIIQLFNLTFNNPQILINGEQCSSTQCVETSFTDGTLTFNVTHFTIYSARETPTTALEVITSTSDEGIGCPPQFICGEWNLCSSEGTQSRTCTDTLCGFPDKDETQDCQYTSPAPAPEPEIIKETRIIIEETLIQKTLKLLSKNLSYIIGGLIILIAIAYAIKPLILKQKRKKRK